MTTQKRPGPCRIEPVKQNNDWKTINQYGETVRGFEVLVLNGRRPIKYPANGCLLLSAEQAIKAMTTLIKRGFEVLARSDEDYLTLAELETLTVIQP